MAGINMSNVKINNRSLILKLLNSEGPLSRKDISKKIGLTPAGVSNLTRELINEGIVVEKGEVENTIKKSGRKKILLDINYKSKKVVGIDIGVDITRIAISDLAGKIEAEIKMDTKTDISATEYLKDIANKIINLLFHNNLLKNQIMGIGIGIVGIVDPDTGISYQAYGIWDYEVDIKSIFKDVFNTNIIVDNNVRALSLAEIKKNTEISGDNILFIKYGPGIGSSMIINNNIYYGSHNNAGEIGHMILDYNGEKCRCGKNGCLESIVSKGAIYDELDISNHQIGSNVNTIDFKEIISKTKKSNKEIMNLMKKISFFIALGISNVISIYDPGKVILHGRAFNYNKFIKQIKIELKKLVPKMKNQDLIIRSHLKENYISGIPIAIDKFFYKTGGSDFGK